MRETWKQGALIGFPVPLIRSSATSIPHLWASPRRFLNVHSPTSAWNSFRRKHSGVRRSGPLQHDSKQHLPSFNVQRSTSTSSRHCSERTRKVEHHREGVWCSRRLSRLPKSKIARRCLGAHQHSSIPPLPSKLGSTAAAPLGSVLPTTLRPLHSVLGSVGFSAPLVDFSFRFLGCN